MLEKLAIRFSYIFKRSDLYPAVAQPEVIDDELTLGDARIRLNSRKWDIAVALMLWLQLMLGLLTVPLSAFHMDGVLFETLTSYVKGIVTLDGSASALMIDVPLTYKLHILLGFTLFLVSPFTRMIHIWSGAGALAYLFRPYQIVRTPRTRAKEPVRS